MVMDNKEKHVRENEPHRHDKEAVDQNIENSLTADGRNRERHNTSKINRLWLWLGVIILIFILLYWLFAIGTFEDIIGYFNG